MDEELKAFLEERAKGDLYGLLTSKREVYSEPAGRHRWWNDVYKVVEIDGRFIGFLDGETTGDNGLFDVGWEFYEPSVAEAFPYQEIVTKYVSVRVEPAGALAVLEEVRNLIADAAEGAETPGGVEHLGDFRRLIMKWDRLLGEKKA